MNVYTNLAPVNSQTDPALLARITRANTAAVDLNNRAGRVSQAGQHNRATQLYKQALEIKISAFGEESVQAAITLNAMAENYLKVKSLDDAEECLRKALKVRDSRDFGGLELGPRNDAAATRDNLGQLFEERGLFQEARDIRMRGAAKGETMCGNVKCSCPGGAMLGADQLQGCDACRSVFYCSKACQKMDWHERHKAPCQAFSAGGNTS